MVGDTSSRAYAKGLLESGGSHELLNEIRKVDHECHAAGVTPIYTLGHLASLSGVSYGQLRKLMLEADKQYTEHKMAKKSGGFRTLHVPSAPLKIVQKFILQNCVPKGPSSPLSFAYTSKRGILDAAEKHVGSRSIIMLDFADFFGSVDSQSVYRLFVSYGYPELLAFEMSALCTFGPNIKLTPGAMVGRPYSPTGRRFLAQGSPSSGALANHVLLDFDKSIRMLEREGYAVTRYADDLTISTADSLSRRQCQMLIRRVTIMSQHHGMTINPRKTKVLLNKSSFRVLGLSVTDTGVGLSRPYKRNFESDVFGISRFGLSAQASFRNYTVEIEFIAHLWGHVAFAAGIDRTWAKRMREALLQLNVPEISVVNVFNASGGVSG
ncbi:reverse transcriptase family protein [Paenarthrobacter histidinolovorans]|uniref:RNA-directed DNA polymerase n=1 Tax=Paenarthrobacter histidinolovorans TaxID=43664 RepID=A0ABW8N975_9MICC